MTGVLTIPGVREVVWNGETETKTKTDREKLAEKDRDRYGHAEK